MLQLDEGDAAGVEVKKPRPEMAAHNPSATQYQRVAASMTVSNPASSTAPTAATPNDSRRRTGLAASDSSRVRARRAGQPGTDLRRGTPMTGAVVPAEGTPGGPSVLP